jgi:hypothetical protein
MNEYQSNLTGYARIVVDYKGGKRVSFSPHDEFQKTLESKFLTVFLFFMLFWAMPIFLFFSIFLSILVPFDSNPIDYLTSAQWLLFEFVCFIVPAIYSIFFTFYYHLIESTIAKVETYSAVLLSRKEILIDDLREREFIIPTFKNIFLEYKAYGEYGDFLDSIEIVDQKYKRKYGKVYKESIVFWKAIFKFSEVPRSGKLEITFV